MSNQSCHPLSLSHDIVRTLFNICCFFSIPIHLVATKYAHQKWFENTAYKKQKKQHNCNKCCRHCSHSWFKHCHASDVISLNVNIELICHIPFSTLSGYFCFWTNWKRWRKSYEQIDLPFYFWRNCHVESLCFLHLCIN